MLKILSYFYFIIYKLLYPLLRRSASFASFFFDEKLKKTVQLRQSYIDYEKLSQIRGAFWIHASSGEIEYAKEIVRILKSKNEKVAISYFSISAEKLLQNVTADYIFPLPWESKVIYKKIIKNMQPKMFILARTDFWPILLNELNFNNLQVHIIAYTHRSNRLSLPWKFLNLSLANSIHTITEHDLAELKKMDLKATLYCTGDPRLDQIFFRQKEFPKKLEVFSDHQRQAVIFSSTWPEDDQYIFPILNEILKNNLVFYAPHELSHISTLETKLKINKISYQCFSKMINYSSSGLILIDQIGLIAFLYSKCKVAFIGGSFKSKVHNLNESLAWGTPCVVGPFYQNSPEAIQYSKININNAKAVQIVTNSADLLDSLSQIRQFDHQQLQNLVLKSGGASKKIVESFYN